MSTIENGKVAFVTYTGTFPDTGEVFDTNVGGEPLPFLVGFRNMIEGFEQEMMGAAEGESRSFTLTPERAYGHRDDSAFQDIPRDQFPTDMEIEPGMVMAAHSDQGPIQFTVDSVDGDNVRIDFNHQMAGKTIHFEVEVKSIRDATSDELSHGHVHGPGGVHHHEEKGDGCGDNCGCH
tara:strand:- start:9884 stop:10417 length:534 start_codon:yes stop_codon:yes gene_type:complete